MTYLHLVHVCAVFLLCWFAVSIIAFIPLSIFMRGCQILRNKEKSLYVEKF